MLATKIGGQQKQRPKGGKPEGGPIPKHRDTIILVLSPVLSSELFFLLAANRRRHRIRT